MANRRMFSLKVVDTDAFLDMPQSSQLLYYSLAMRADDDGFISNPKKIMRMLGSQDDDFKVLIGKKFIIPFESGVCVIKHWLIHNLIRGDRYAPTQWVREKEKLEIEEKTNKYSLKSNVIPNGNQVLPQVRLGKDSIGKDIELPLWINKEKWMEWEQYRIEKRKKLTKSTRIKQIQFLFIHSKDHVKIIDRSIMNGWQVLFPLDNKFSNSDARKVLDKRIEDDEIEREKEINSGDDQARKKILQDIKKLGADKSIK